MTSETSSKEQIDALKIELDIAEAIIAQLDVQALEDVQTIALLMAKLRARDKLIGRLSDRIKTLEESLYEDDLATPPPALAEAFANLKL